MTYAMLAEAIAHMSDEQKNMDVTIYCKNTDEFFGVTEPLCHTIEDDVLDKDHPFLAIDG
jgi:hypothetical protein